jgi:carbonic anhydrase/acetyltransferase-like protein (isoleucine patch superfamily)
LKEEKGTAMIRNFSGKTPLVADSAFVSEVAYVVGDVEIGE